MFDFFQEVARAIEMLYLLYATKVLVAAGGIGLLIAALWSVVGICKCVAWIIDHRWDFGMGVLSAIEIACQSMTGDITSLITKKRPLYQQIAVAFWAVLAGWAMFLFFTWSGVLMRVAIPYVIAGIALSIPTSIGLWLVISLFEGGKKPRLAHVPTVMRIAVTWVAPVMVGIPLFRPAL